MPDHIKLILRHAFFGFLIALGFTGLILAFDVANIRHLVTHTAEGMIALGVFVVLCTITFGSVQIGMAIMSMGEETDDDGPQGNAPEVHPGAVPDFQTIPVPVKSDPSAPLGPRR